MNTNVRPSPLAGRWYPADPTQLKTQVNEFMGEKVTLGKPLWGLLVPHAGLQYSGSIAGKAFRYTNGLAVDLVVIIAPSHHHYPASLLSTMHSHFETPLGQVPVALDVVKALSQKLNLLPVINDPEHAIEIELPFLQCTLPDFQLLPLAMLDQSWEAASLLGETIAELLKDRTVLLVASSDLSHFYSQKDANKLDQVILDKVADYQPAQVIEADEKGQGFACGRGAIAAVMIAAQKLGAISAEIVGYATSGDTSGDMTRVVGYGAALFH